MHVGVFEIVTSLHDGFANMPKLWGSEVRKPGKIDNFADGLKEGGKGFFYGYFDGIKGLVADPINGAKKEVSCWLGLELSEHCLIIVRTLQGFLGAIKGSARSCEWPLWPVKRPGHR